MRYEEKKAEIHKKYLPKTQRIIDVLGSCVNPEQAVVCEEWANRLFNQWRTFEIGKNEYCIETIAVIHEIENLKEMFQCIWHRTWEGRT